MAKQLQLRRGTTAQHASFTGAPGEVTVDTDKKALVVHDGATAGGVPVARAGGNATQRFKVADAQANDEAVALGQFSSQLAKTGYQRLPSGLILQWMEIVSATTSGTAIFPIAFPNAGLVALAHDNAGGATDGSIVRLSLPTTTGVSWFGQTYTLQEVAPATWSLIVIGY